MGGWIEGWMNGWVDIKAGSRIAYSNQNLDVFENFFSVG